MKQLLRAALAPLALCVLLCLTPAVSTSCSTWKSSTYKSTGVTVVTAQTAMTAWANYVANGHATPEQEAKVRAAYGKYQTAILAVIAAGKSATTATNNFGLETVINAAAGAQAELVGVVQSFLPKELK